MDEISTFLRKKDKEDEDEEGEREGGRGREKAKKIKTVGKKLNIILFGIKSGTLASMCHAGNKIGEILTH